MRRHAAPADAGFSLMEALVALVVLAVASVALLRATQSHIDLVGGLQARATAQWVAENRMVELRLAPFAAQPRDTAVEMMGLHWRVHVDSRRTDDPDITAVTIGVAPATGGGDLATLDGFVDTGATP